MKGFQKLMRRIRILQRVSLRSGPRMVAIRAGETTEMPTEAAAVGTKRLAETKSPEILTLASCTTRSPQGMERVVSTRIIPFYGHSSQLTISKMPAEGTIGASRAKGRQLTQPGESNQDNLPGKSLATMAGTIQAAILETATRVGAVGLTMDPKARIAMALKEEMRITAKAGTSRAHNETVLSGEVRTEARIGTKKAQVLMEGTPGAGLQGPSQLLTTPGGRATAVVRGMVRVAGPTRRKIMVFRATCQALGTITQALNPESLADPTSLLKVGAPPLPAIIMTMSGLGPPHPMGHLSLARAATKAGEQGPTKVEARRASGTQEAEAQQQAGMTIHPTTLDRPPTRGRLTLLGIPKGRQRIGSGSTGLCLRTLHVIGVVIGGDPDRGTSVKRSRRSWDIVFLVSFYRSSLSALISSQRKVWMVAGHGVE
jgi:hypothetical protein